MLVHQKHLRISNNCEREKIERAFAEEGRKWEKVKKHKET